MKDSLAIVVMFVISVAAFTFVKYRNQVTYSDPDPIYEIVVYDDICRCDLKKVVKNFAKHGQNITFTYEGMELKVDSSLVKNYCIK